MLALSGAGWGAVGLIGATGITSAVALVVAWWGRSTRVDSKIDVAVQAVIDQLEATNKTAQRAEQRAQRAETRAEECEERAREHLRRCHGGGDG